MYERQREHMKDCLSRDTKSHRREHWKERHGNERGELETVEEVAKAYEVKILEKYRTALQRQIGGTVHIRRATGQILNDKDEFNRCKLPKLSVSKQKQKTLTTTRYRKIGEETEKLQAMRPETQFKRRERQNGKKEMSNEGGERVRGCKRQKRHLKPETDMRQKRI